MECPFCGIVSDGPHESQEACIAALHAEIERVRLVVDSLQNAAVPGPAEPAGDPFSPAPLDVVDDEEPQF